MLWFIEVANALLVSERRKRVTEAEMATFFELLKGLALIIDAPTASRAFVYTLPLARTYGSAGHDATYLELAMREGLMLATLDVKLKSAAEQVGVPVFA